MTPNATEKVCSYCGSKGSHDVRYVACLAQTMYCTGGVGSYLNNDHLAIWRVSLCSTCMPKALLFHLDGQLRSAIKTAGIGVLAVIGAVVMLWAAIQLGIGSDLKSDSVVAAAIKAPKNFHHMMYVLLTVGLFAVGVLMIPYGTVKALVNFVQRRMMTATDTVPPRWLDRCFVGEAERSLALLRKPAGTTSTAAIDYPLPKFKELSELSEEKRRRALEYQGSVQWRKRTIISSVGLSHQQLLSKLTDDVSALVPEYLDRWRS